MYKAVELLLLKWRAEGGAKGATTPGIQPSDVFAISYRIFSEERRTYV